MGSKFLIVTLFLFISIFCPLFSSNPIVDSITLGREFTAVGLPLVTTTKILSYIQNERGGEIYQHEKNPKKFVLKDKEGKKWGAEVDGELPDGRIVYEVQTPPLDGKSDSLMLLPLRALLSAKTTPLYSVGGGHIHIDVARYFELYPYQFASLVNFLLNYEETLTYIFSNPRRLHTIRKLSEVRLDNNSKTLAQYLGQLLNYYIDREDRGCENDARLNKYITEKSKSCIIAALSHFACDVVPSREMDINLQSWKCSSAKKTHGTLEMRFFNSPKLEEEVLLETELLRGVAQLAVNSESKPILYAPVVDSLVGENAYIDDNKLHLDLNTMLKMLGLAEDGFYKIYIERLGERRHPGK